LKRCMAFDGRTDPNHGYEEKSPCTVINFRILNMEYSISYLD
jgi:hypothetical protein